jgi:hypothetical protein
MIAIMIPEDEYQAQQRKLAEILRGGQIYRKNKILFY